MKTLSILVVAVMAAISVSACDRLGTKKTGASAPASTTTTTVTTAPSNPAQTADTTTSSAPSTTASASTPTAATGSDSTNAVSDTVVTGKVKTAITADSGMKDTDISVTTQNGVVTLTGTAKSPDQVTLAAALAQRQEGVSRVENQVAVR